MTGLGNGGGGGASVIDFLRRLKKDAFLWITV